MKRLLACLVTLITVISLAGCDLKKITDMMDNEKSEDTGMLSPVLVEWESDGIEFKSHADAVKRNDYYRYSGLGEKDKALYDDIYDAVISGVSVLDVSKHKIKGDDVEKIYHIFMADNPSLFYISRTCKYVYSNDDGIVSEILLMYSDGEITDEFDSNCKLIKTADREVIADKISELEKCVNSILEDIPENTSEIDKEKLIHDYIVDNTKYNNSDVSRYENSDTVPHIFDAYGALCETEAVCEGYAKAFQLLCYEAGINCIQAEGVGNSSQHMWNAVLLDDWYYVDVTWNDDVDGDLPYYAYFNIPDEVFFEDHILDTTYLSVPKCEGEKYSYYNYYCAKVTTDDMPPENYKRLADSINDGKLDYAVIYSPFVTLTDVYLREHFLDENSVFMNYVNAKGYGISLMWEYHMVGDYYYIPVD